MFGDVIETVITDSRGHKRKKTILDDEGLIEKILKDIATTADCVKNNIEKSIIDYTTAPQKHVVETDEDVIVYLDLPGVQKEDIKLKISESELKIKANFDITHEIEQENGVFTHDEKSGVFKISVQFPSKIVSEESEATFQDSVLTVKAPKVEKTESFTVEIK
ncbi:MAG: Hsp20/alpha crystallin family protein [Methanobacterium sp.]|nr:Hsp20/alpha crystallin family protein [Methanobacterium sp.]